MKRREFIASGLVPALGISGLNSISFERAAGKRALRMIHLTDMHIEPGIKIKNAINAMLQQIRSMDDQPDFILNTGDNIMDALYGNRENVHAQWQAWLEYFRNDLKYELHSCIGNHDIWGWGQNDRKITEDPLYGKLWAAGMLEMPERYYSFLKRGWKFICLDSTYSEKNNVGYTAKLDQEQFEWLEHEIKNTPAEVFICIASHIPILSVAAFFDGDNLKKENWQVPGAWMHTDAKKLKDLFFHYPNVKAAFSGHIHMVDHIEYLSVKYFCNGSVCGKWWIGNYHEFGPSYAVVDFFEDGTVQSSLHPIRW